MSSKIVLCGYLAYYSFFFCGSLGFGQTTNEPDSLSSDGRNEDSARFFVEVMPVYPGGEAAYMKFINENFRYPAQAREEGIQGRVVVEFTIDTTGEVINERVIVSVHPAIDAEALRVIRLVGNWTPGTQDGVAVKVLFKQSINFTLEDEMGKKKKKKKLKKRG